MTEQTHHNKMDGQKGRANQNYRTSKVEKTIFKKQIVKVINHHRHERHAPISHRRASMPVQALTNEPTSNSKEKQRKARHELNKLRRIHRESNSDSSSESPQSSEKKRKTPVSSMFNMSRKSWAHLPKKVVIYHPGLNTTQEERVRITNAHFEQALGQEAARKFLQSYQYERVIDANSQMILERPSSGDEETSADEDSERDPLDYLNFKLPKLMVVPMDQS